VLKKMFTILTNTCHSTLKKRDTFSSAFRMAYVATCVLIQHKQSLSQFMFCLGHTSFNSYVGFIVSITFVTCPFLSLFWTCSFSLVSYSYMVRSGTDYMQTTSQFSLFVVVVVVVVELRVSSVL
jgi:hypothetical protein